MSSRAVLIGGPFDGRTFDPDPTEDEKVEVHMLGLEAFAVYRISVGVFDNRDGQACQVYQWVGSRESRERELGVEI